MFIGIYVWFIGMKINRFKLAAENENLSHIERLILSCSAALCNKYSNSDSFRGSQSDDRESH